MFNSTQNLMFRPITSLAHFKIHPPLPLNPRESKQLLNLLTTSFRQQLDREHGAFRSEVDGSERALSGSAFPNPTTGKRRRHLQARPESRLPTDRHLHSILTNPLFSHGPEKSGIRTQNPRDPMDIFDEACAKGFMKVEYALACLRAKKNTIVQSSVLSVREAMKESGAGSKVLRWLISSGVADDVTFLRDEVFSEILVDFLVAEELQLAVWTWMDKLMAKLATANMRQAADPADKSAANLLDVLVKAEASGYISLDLAFTSFMKAKELLDKIQHPPRPILSKAGLFLSRESTFKSSLHLASSPVVFNGFLDVVPAFTSHRDLHLSHLLLHHPTNPNTGPALRFLRKAKADISISAEILSQGSSGCKTYPDSRIISLGLDTAKLLLEQDENVDARWVMSFLQETYAKQLGLTQKKQFEQAQAEASSLELLKSLNLA
jgi:hypothetical protein